MDESTNGHKRPFGPHGEGCTCEPDGSDEKECSGPKQIPINSPREAGPRTAIIEPANSLHEIQWAAASESLAMHLLSAINTCGAHGEPLTERQIAHLMAGQLRGFALAKDTAGIIEMQLHYEAQRIAEAAEAQRASEEKKPELHDVDELFRRRGDKPSDDQS